MTETAITRSNNAALAQNGNGELSLIEQALVVGDLSKLTSKERANYYAKVCESVGLNPLTRPFDYLTLNNKLILYARKDCTDQLRSLKGVSITIASSQSVGDLYVVNARATLPTGRVDEEIGAVSTAGLRGDALANAMMKATTKAKRRVTLSICGLGMLDETEVETIPDARRHVEEEPPRALNGPNLPVSRTTAPEPASEPAEPAVMTGEEMPEGEAEEVAALFDERGPKSIAEVLGHAFEGVDEQRVERIHSPLREEVRALHAKVVAVYEFRSTKLPADDAPDEVWGRFIDYWTMQLENRARAAERRGQSAGARAR